MSVVWGYVAGGIVLKLNTTDCGVVPGGNGSYLQDNPLEKLKPCKYVTWDELPGTWDGGAGAN